MRGISCETYLFPINAIRGRCARHLGLHGKCNSGYRPGGAGPAFQILIYFAVADAEISVLRCGNFEKAALMQLTLENIAGRAGYSIGGVKQRWKDEERRMSTVMALPCIKAEVTAHLGNG